MNDYSSSTKTLDANNILRLIGLGYLLISEIFNTGIDYKIDKIEKEVKDENNYLIDQKINFRI